MANSKDQLKLNGSSSVTLTAVALQDHWSRSISLGPKFGPNKVGLGPAARSKQRKDVKSVIDTGNRGKKLLPAKDSKTAQEKEYVLDVQPPPLTLAQKFGLVTAPKPLLTENEWTEIKQKSNGRDDSGEPCVICKEDFGLEGQVLLSCTHVFHKACLQAFERFTGRKTCPMCRHDQYQTRVIHEGARLHRHKCATKIQSLWRGYVVRSWYKKLRITVPPKDPTLRKKFYEEKMSSIIDRMVKSLDMNVAAFMRELDASVQQSRLVFSQWDAAHMTISDSQWEDIQLKAVRRGDVDCPICLTELCMSHPGQKCDDANTQTIEDSKKRGDNINTASTTPPSCHTHTHNSTKQNRKMKDQKLFSKITKLEKLPLHANKCNPQELAALENGGLPDPGTTATAPVRAGDVCAIDNAKDEAHQISHGAVTEGVQQGVQHRVRSTVLLSCSHVFHTTCLNTLEEMGMLDIRNTCPICRAHYQKKVVVY